VSHHERSGVLVLRVWIEPVTTESLRARITAERDLQSRERVSVAAASVPEILEIVRDWVEEFAATGGA
jgi:SRSO17 transposase